MVELQIIGVAALDDLQHVAGRNHDSGSPAGKALVAETARSMELSPGAKSTISLPGIVVLSIFNVLAPLSDRTRWRR